MVRQSMFAAIFAGGVVAGLIASGERTTPESARRASGGEGGPRLVVSVAVDQLRPDLLERFGPALTRGFRRLREDGFTFTNGVQDHAITHTAAGHAALSTGVYPARNGIVGNDWSERRGDEWVTVYSVEDPAARVVGVEAGPGRSPRNLLRPGLPDWLVAADPAAQVASFSRKDRSAVSLAAQARGHVYWVSSSAGRWVTSDHYRPELPAWVEDVNRTAMPALLSSGVWEPIVPAGWAGLSRPDTAEFEGDGEWTYFPHRFSDGRPEGTEAQRNAWLLETTPAADAAVLAIAERALTELGLGQRGSVDYLAVSFSAADGVGHEYGPFSREQLDNLFRLDILLDRLMDLLDDQVGEGGWVMGLSSDHGVLEVPEYSDRPGARRTERAERLAMRQALAELEEQVTDTLELADRLAAALVELPAVASAIPAHRLTEVSPADSMATLFARSWRPDRVVGTWARQGVLVRFEEGILDGAGSRGTSHGTPYHYDRHVPIIFIGAGVTPGSSGERARTVDFAPTLAALAGISFPEDLDGRVLLPIGRDPAPQLP